MRPEIDHGAVSNVTSAIVTPFSVMTVSLLSVVTKKGCSKRSLNVPVAATS